MRKVLFTGKTSVKKLNLAHHQGIEAKVTPSIITEEGKGIWGEDELRVGLLLQCTPLTLLKEADGENFLEPFEEFNGHEALCEPILWWRALQCVEAMPVIENHLFCHALYWGAGRYKPESHFQKYMDEVRQYIGSQVYEEIMARPIPKEILDIILQMATTHPDSHMTYQILHALSEEVDAKTVRWSQELRRIGVRHPDYWRAQAAAKATILKRYKPYLCAYATHLGYPSYDPEGKDSSMALIGVEWGVVKSVVRGIEELYGADVACLLGISYGEISTDEAFERSEKDAITHIPGYRENQQPFTLPTHEERFQETATWFMETFQVEPISGNSVQRSQEDYVEQLRNLYNQWEQLPVVHPLVPEPNKA